jgi:hypothetical protein
MRIITSCIIKVVWLRLLCVDKYGIFYKTADNGDKTMQLCWTSALSFLLILGKNKIIAKAFSRLIISIT